MTYLHPTIAIKSGSSSAEMKVDAGSLAGRVCKQHNADFLYSGIFNIAYGDTENAALIYNPASSGRKISIIRVRVSITGGTNAQRYWRIKRGTTDRIPTVSIGIPHDSLSPAPVAMVVNTASAYDFPSVLWAGYIAPDSYTNYEYAFEFDFIKLFGKPIILEDSISQQYVVIAPETSYATLIYTYSITWMEE